MKITIYWSIIIIIIIIIIFVITFMQGIWITHLKQIVFVGHKGVAFL